MRRLLLALGGSLAVYAVAFSWLLDRPLSLGFIRTQLDAKLARAAAVGSPKLVILAGSNGPYSHRCEVIEPILGMPCVNGGVAVGIGLDYLFARWQQQLAAGDLVYLPMEESQYVRPKAAMMLGPDAAIMLRHDWRTLSGLSAMRWIASLFSGNLRGVVMSILEEALAARGFHDPRPEVTGMTNAWGDHVSHTPALGAPNIVTLAQARPVHVSTTAIRSGDGSVEIGRFVQWAEHQGVIVIGGLPTGFSDVPPPAETIAAIKAVYLAPGGRFIELSNDSQYPRSAFFDTPEHLNEPAQLVHSRLLAAALVREQRQARWSP
jgi:hypothetical protein